MSRWFRFYDGALDDPKVQALPADLFKVWVNLLCVASRCEGRLPAADLPFMLRMSPEAVGEALRALSVAGLVDMDDVGAAPHNWDARQFKSDTSNERVKRHRERSRNASRNDEVTLQVTPPETEQKQNRAEGERPRAQAVRLPDAWTATADDVAYAKAQGVPDDVLDREQSKFRNHYHGNGATRVDWSAAWRKWIDGTCEKAGYKPATVPVLGSVPSVRIRRVDPRYPACEKRYIRENGGKKPFCIASKEDFEEGAYFPSSWEETRISSAVAAA